MKKIYVFIMLLSSLLSADENVKKLVLDLTTSDIAKFEKGILKAIVFNTNYYESSFKELKTSVIIHGGAYKFFIKDTKSISKGLQTRIKSLQDNYDVEFLICGAGMKSRDIKQDNIYSFVKITPNAMIGLINKQNDGYAYVPVK